MIPAMGPFIITTRSGAGLNLAEPDPASITVQDVAAALSKICRFQAQTSTFYSVAQHAIEVSERVPAELALAALHHDSQNEAFIGDIPTPLKQLILERSDVYEAVGNRIDAAIGAALGIDPELFGDRRIKDADEEVRLLEAQQLLADGGESIRKALTERGSSAAISIEPGRRMGVVLSAEDAENKFLDVHARLAGLRPA